MKRIFKLILKITITILLTLMTQIGGLVYLISEIVFFKTSQQAKIKKLIFFLSFYMMATFIIVPYLAPVFGREKIKNNDLVASCSLFTIICNRNYVTPELQESLQNIAQSIHKKHSGIKLIYLDANFPFINGFPLLPHLSHNDGKKIDVSFIYNHNQKLTNKKPAILGYGIYEAPTPLEFDQISSCKEKGYWHYDFPKYLTFGIRNNELKFSKKATKDLLLTIVEID